MMAQNKKEWSPAGWSGDLSDKMPLEQEPEGREGGGPADI